MNIFSQYDHIMSKEVQLRTNSSKNTTSSKTSIVSSTEMYGTTLQIAEVAKSCFVPRVYLERYNIHSEKQAHESVSAHTNLLRAILDRYLINCYGPNFGEANSEHPLTTDGFSYRQIMEAASMHDLPENKIGDIPDNGAYDKKEKEPLETEYFYSFARNCPASEIGFYQQVLKLLSLMDNPYSPTGSILRAADKTAAVFMALTYDAHNEPPLMAHDDPLASNRDREEMSICDINYNGFYRASEMWTIDLLCIRKIIELDSTNFLLGLVVMYTLMVNGHWYNWRERSYLNI